MYNFNDGDTTKDERCGEIQISLSVWQIRCVCYTICKLESWHVMQSGAHLHLHCSIHSIWTLQPQHSNLNSVLVHLGRMKGNRSTVYLMSVLKTDKVMRAWWQLTIKSRGSTAYVSLTGNWGERMLFNFPVRQAKNMLFCRRSSANNKTSVIQSGTRNLPRFTYAEFSKHVCLQWLNPLGYYGTKSPPDPPKNRPLKALFMSGLWGESNGPKDSVDRGFSTCYHWGHIPKDSIGQGLNKSPSTAD